VADDLLERYAVDLTARARSGGIDAVIGREDEVRQLVDILSRRRQNNPLLVGEAGVGKTAVVEGFALAVAQREVPRHLEAVTVLALDLGLLQAGATLEGEFEERLQGVLDAVRGADQRMVLFLDEVHMLIGAGGAAGTGDAANLLKPALARGEVSVIAATTWREFKVHIEPDPALTRRFQTVVVDEPGRAVAIAMLRGVARNLEEHHGVRVRDEAVIAAVDLSTRYVTGRQLPDKAIGLLDTACARVRIAQSATPGAVEQAARSIAWLDAERSALQRERDDHGTVAAVDDRLDALEASARAAESSLELLEGRWQRERALVKRIYAVRDELRRGDRNQAEAERSQVAPTTSTPAPHIQRKLEGLEQQLEQAQDDARLVPLDVDAPVVAEVVERWTGIPVARLRTDDASVLSDLEHRLEARVVGQPQALRTIARRLRTARVGLDGPDRPLGVFLLVGPPGVGKTETAHALVSELYGGPGSLVTLDMAEYREAHTLSKLRGAPPGYVGHGRGGHLTEAVRRRPYCVVLLDDVDRAHPDVVAAFLPAFDRGRMEDGEGTVVDFSHALVLMTSNLDVDRVRDRLGRPVIERATIVPYSPLGVAELAKILRRGVDEIAVRLRARHGIGLEMSPRVERSLAQRIADADLAGRGVGRMLNEELMPEIAAFVLAGHRASAVEIAVTTDGRIAVSPVALADASTTAAK